VSESARERRHADALNRAARALEHRDRSRAALASRLDEAGVDAAARESALAALERAGILDDRRLALSRAASLVERGYGDAAVRFALEREGIPGELVEEALAGLEPESERARRLAEARGGGPKAARLLASRGFEATTVEEAVGRFADGE
jgi:SOS response regulatory protein OraA/RecX